MEYGTTDTKICIFASINLLYMTVRKLPVIVFPALAAATLSHAQGPVPSDNKNERPNILWLTFEDTSASNFGCYGNTHVSTPVVDSLASVGVQYMNAWSCAPQSSPARSSLITGCLATTYGMDIHPVSQETPDGLLFPELLRDAGYYCTNNNKTHYNTTRNNKACWDECDKQASYNSAQRKEGQPFFAVFNSVASHMGRIRTFHTHGRRDYSLEGIAVDSLTLPSYIPDLPEVRSDYAGHLESTQDIDKWAGLFLEDLRAKGLADDTIIFFFSDHGGCIPRGKGYLYESGLRVPLIVYFPEKWKHLSRSGSGQCDDLVNFTDLGPTVLSLAGIRPPEHMQGKALHGEYADKDKREVQFAFAANQLHHFMPVRAVTDGKYKLIRSYIPYRQFALRNYYQWGMPSNKAWDRYVLEDRDKVADKTKQSAWALPFNSHPAEMLFNLESDPGEINDLSTDPEYASILENLRNKLSCHIRQSVDLGFFLPDTRKGVNQYERVRKEAYPLEDMYRLVEAAGLGKDAKLFEKAVRSESADFRFWGAVGYATLPREGVEPSNRKKVITLLTGLLDDESPYVACEAAYALAYWGKPSEAIARLVNPVMEEDRKIGYSALECLSLDTAMRPYIMEHAQALRQAGATLPRKANEDAGLMARGILVNLGLLEIDLLHGPEVYEDGLKLNKGRRKMRPTP